MKQSLHGFIYNPNQKDDSQACKMQRITREKTQKERNMLRKRQLQLSLSFLSVFLSLLDYSLNFLSHVLNSLELPSVLFTVPVAACAMG